MTPHAETGSAFVDSPIVRSKPISKRVAAGMPSLKGANNIAANEPALLRSTAQDAIHDIIGVGFGPAALAIAVALHDSLESDQFDRQPRVCFLERQEQFAWHSGMQIPGATMQISWIKDLATIRNPRSRFTFLNYLHSKGRLLPFINLNTFLPKRREYEDYMRWCAKAFDDVVAYGQEAHEISPERSSQGHGKVDVFVVKTRNVKTGQVEVRRARHVIVAGGGQAAVPAHVPQDHPRITHSSKYMHVVPRILPGRDHPHRIAVLGAGQSAAETFNDLHTRYPNSHTRLIIRGSALEPSDDSPFVNEVFEPHRTDAIYNAAPDIRAQDIRNAKETNYSVVRLTLLEHIYESLYEQRLDHTTEEEWPHRILNFRDIVRVEAISGKDGPLRLHIRDHNPSHNGTGAAKDETLDVDAVVVATGYERNLHEQLLVNAESLKPAATGETTPQGWQVSRDYRIKFKEGSVSPDAGVWLQGCCEDTHGLSDTLLSVLAPRAGEIIESIFGAAMVTPRFGNLEVDGSGEQAAKEAESQVNGALRSKITNGVTSANSFGQHLSGQTNGYF